MTPAPRYSSSTALALASLLTLGFVGCFGETKSLNTPMANGGEEGESPVAGTGGSAAGKAGGSLAGKAGGASRAGHAGTAGKAAGHAGTSGTSGVSGRSEVGGSSMGGTSFAGSAGNGVGGTNQGGAGSAGAPAGGVGNAGFGGAGYPGAGGPPGGSAGGAGAPQGCSTDGSTGCPTDDVCVDHPYDGCSPSSACPGDCATVYKASRCDPNAPSSCPTAFVCSRDKSGEGECAEQGVSECAENVDCPDGFLCLPWSGGGSRCMPDSVLCGGTIQNPTPYCPPGYAGTAIDEDILCVALEHCVCHGDGDCEAPSVCNHVPSGYCRTPSAPAPRCTYPFASGPCDAAIKVYAFIDGECRAAVYGGCEGNDNRFSTIEECWSACEGRPLEQSCPEGHIATRICLACGDTGGCALHGQFCATPCESNDDCTGSTGLECRDGLCQAFGCE